MGSMYWPATSGQAMHAQEVADRGGEGAREGKLEASCPQHMHEHDAAWPDPSIGARTGNA